MTETRPEEAHALQRHWQHLASRYGLRIDAPFSLRLGDQQLTVPVRLRDFGGSCGMLLVTDSALVVPLTDALVALGFGYSCLSAPAEPEDVHHESLIEMLSDWGWSGGGDPPAWLEGGPG